MTKRGEGGRREVSRKLRGLDQVGTGDFLKERAPSGMTIISEIWQTHCQFWQKNYFVVSEHRHRNVPLFLFIMHFCGVPYQCTVSMKNVR